jgi:hypothetical protein
LLSDLGVTTFHSKISRSAVPISLAEAFGYTGPYRPLEMVMPGMYVCQKYDIWSLGCVFVEFCIWWLEGIEAVERFECARMETEDLYSNVEEDRCFVVRKLSGEKLVPEVKPVVLEVGTPGWWNREPLPLCKKHNWLTISQWIGRLRKEHKNDGFAIPMLDLIELRHDETPTRSVNQNGVQR